MDGSNGGSNAPAPFLTKTYEMVEDPLTNSIVSWSRTGRSFIVWNPPDFARDLLPQYFKHNNFSSFIRQLNTYGFRKIDPEQWEFANDEFIRGQKHLLKNIYRRKPIHSHSAQGSSAAPLTDSERQAFEEEIERLRQDKSSLQLEVERNRQEKRKYQMEIGSLEERLQNLDHRQRQLVAFVGELLQKPEFLSDLTRCPENNYKKRRLLESNFLYDEAKLGENQFMTSPEEYPVNTAVSMLNSDLIGKLDSSVNFLENFLYGTSKTSTEEMPDFGSSQQPSLVLTAPRHASFDVSDLNVQCYSSSHQSSPSGDIPCSPELPSSHVNSPVISSIYVDLDSRPKSPGIDMNASPASTLDVESIKDQASGKPNPSGENGAVNDVFWQQFLTEAPSSAHAQEVQSERREFDGNNCGKIFPDYIKPKWHLVDVDNLTEQLVHLTSAKRS